MIPILNRYTGDVIEEFDNLSGTNFAGIDLSNADFYGADLSHADLSYCNLTGADLHDADLFGADLQNACLRFTDLTGADLFGANLIDTDFDGVNRGKYIINQIPITINGLQWFISIWDEHMEIGCESHLFYDWERFSDKQIGLMHTYALDFWKRHKKSLLALCETRRAS